MAGSLTRFAAGRKMAIHMPKPSGGTTDAYVFREPGDDSQSLPAWDSVMVTSLIDAAPYEAFAAIDQWAAQVTAVSTKLAAAAPPPAEASALCRRFQDAQQFVEKWMLMREAVPAGSEHITAENHLMALFLKTFKDAEHVYLNKTVYTVSAEQFIEAPVKLLDFLTQLVPLTGMERYFVARPQAVQRVADVIHDTFVVNNSMLRVDHTRVLYGNCTAQLSKSGIDLLSTKAVSGSVQAPLVPRAYVMADLVLEEHKNVVWDPTLFIPQELMPFVAAMMMPNFLRQTDLRPVLLLATWPAGDSGFVHPLLWAVHVFCELSIATVLPTEEQFNVHRPYVFYVDAVARVLVAEDLVNMKTALGMGMVVVLAAGATPPPLLLMDCEEYLRLNIVHVHAQQSFSAFAAQTEVMTRLLPASHAARMREPERNQRLLGFLNTPALLKFRLGYRGARKSTVGLLVEMLQVEMGLVLKVGATASMSAVTAVFDKYQEARYVGDSTWLACGFYDVVQATQVYRSHFGFVRMLHDVHYNADSGLFVNLAVSAPCE
jgi:hypothetical protein